MSGNGARDVELEQIADKLITALTQAGFAIVPLDATPEMLQAGLAERNVSGTGPRGLPHVWRAMVKSVMREKVWP